MPARGRLGIVNAVLVDCFSGLAQTALSCRFVPLGLWALSRGILCKTSPGVPPQTFKPGECG